MPSVGVLAVVVQEAQETEFGKLEGKLEGEQRLREEAERRLAEALAEIERLTRR